MALADASPEEWVGSMAAEANQHQPDSVFAAIEGLQELSVDPGPRELIDFDGGYNAVFPESRWTWRLPGGRIGSITGESVVEWRPGGYRWVTVPIFQGGGAEVGPREKLCMGVISMVAVLLVSVFGVWYAKRRFG
ncbi:MAG TPA: hypothetical protein P5207_05460 [Candidatus Sabulitectum sp.]|nr:hypothetical protein [Candidatus Sabulitectum sp.]HPR22650.1 hypothetical protein [Candidatus Sabulitectum sp.]HRW78097.1 hypothetical protein [Candidatus Sabulitectum sp.]